MTADRRYDRRPRRFALALLAGGLAALMTAKAPAQQPPGSAYNQRAAIFDPGTARKRVNPAPPVVRQRPGVHRSYYADQREGQYQNRSIPPVRHRASATRSRTNPATLANGMGLMGGMGMGIGGMGAPGMNLGNMLYGSGGGATGTYGGARPR